VTPDEALFSEQTQITIDGDFDAEINTSAIGVRFTTTPGLIDPAHDAAGITLSASPTRITARTPVRGAAGESDVYLVTGVGLNQLVTNALPFSFVATGEEGEFDETHSSDYNADGHIDLSELLRVIQFFNSDGLHCDSTTEDRYAPGPGDRTCAHYAGDYLNNDWIISLSELLRAIQFFNSAGYFPCPGEGTDDGYCVTPR
jgi:hypothetical protein